MFGKNVRIKEVIPFDLQRKVAAYKTLESWETIPHAGIILELDVTKLLQFVKKLRKDPEYEGLKLTINIVMLKVIVECIKASPELNSYVKYNKKKNFGEIIVCEDINISMPLLLKDGRTITPVMENVGEKNLKEICIAMADLLRRVGNTNVDMLLFEAAMIETMERLRKGKIWSVLRRGINNLMGKNKIKRLPKAERIEYKKIPVEDRITAENLLKSTILVSNIGPALRGLKCTIGLLEIIPPHMTVIGVPSIRKAPIAVKNDKGEYVVEVRDVLPISLYCDHKGMDFGPTVAGLRRILHVLENPEELLDDPKEK
jgi:pyruvate/2-oxoglutarate dehydrogenase complex dihydrolipoamide acyltransferase (E2) component